MNKLIRVGQAMYELEYLMEHFSVSLSLEGVHNSSESGLIDFDLAAFS